MKITGKEVDIFCEIDPSLAELVVTKKGPKNTIRTAQEGFVRMCQIGTIVVQIIFVHPKGHGFLNEPIQSVRSKRKHQGKTVHSVLVCG